MGAFGAIGWFQKLSSEKNRRGACARRVPTRGEQAKRMQSRERRLRIFTELEWGVAGGGEEAGHKKTNGVRPHGKKGARP